MSDNELKLLISKERSNFEGEWFGVKEGDGISMRTCKKQNVGGKEDFRLKGNEKKVKMYIK